MARKVYAIELYRFFTATGTEMWAGSCPTNDGDGPEVWSGTADSSQKLIKAMKAAVKPVDAPKGGFDHCWRSALYPAKANAPRPYVAEAPVLTEALPLVDADMTRDLPPGIGQDAGAAPAIETVDVVETTGKKRKTKELADA